MPSLFSTLIFNARPAAGKSEILHALAQTPLPARIERFHVGEMIVLDDFPMLWAWFEEDALLEQVFQRPRLHTTAQVYFQHPDLWHLLIRRLDLEFARAQRDHPEPHTTILEFSRGAEHGGYRAAYQHLGPQVLAQAACVYVRVSYAESFRKNRRRFNPQRPDSLLEHGLTDEKMERLYREDDWEYFSAADPELLHVGSTRLPYIVFENEDDVTTAGGEALLTRLEQAFGRLWSLHCRQRPAG